MVRFLHDFDMTCGTAWFLHGFAWCLHGFCMVRFLHDFDMTCGTLVFTVLHGFFFS